MLQRLAMGHLVFMLQIAPIGANPISTISHTTVADAVKTNGLSLLGQHYTNGWERLLATDGPLPLIPAAAVKVTPTRWDLANLWLLQACRGAAPLMSLVPPNAGAVANGMLIAELKGHGEVLEWKTPLDVLTSHRVVLGQPPPPSPPILLFDPTQPPTMLNTTEADELRVWCKLYLWGKGKDNAERSGPNQALRQHFGRKRKLRKPARLMDSDDSESSSS